MEARVAIITSVACRCSSSGRAPPCQGGGSEFEPRHLLQKKKETGHMSCLFLFLDSVTTTKRRTSRGCPASVCRKTFPAGSLAEFRRPQATESDQNSSFPGTCASEMTLLMAGGATISQEIESRPPCSLLSKKALVPFSTVSRRTSQGCPAFCFS